MQIEQDKMDVLDKALLNEIQWEFPLAQRPFLKIGLRHNISEQQVMDRIFRMKKIGLIRQINAIFDTRNLGYKSALIAFAVVPEMLDVVANEVNKHPGVSHNYERNHEYNMWFTLAIPPNDEMKPHLDRLAKLEGVTKYRLLPTLKLYKIGVKLDMINDDPEKLVPKDSVVKSKKRTIDLTPRDKAFIRELQTDLDIVSEPFKEQAARLGVSIDELFDVAKGYQDLGIMRRFAAILRHREAGFTANGMVVWNVPHDRIDEVGYKLASFSEVSHCYRRPVYPDWQFNLFSMIHARTFESAEKMASEMSSVVGIKDYRILFSSREFKKDRVKYFLE
ncbi:MAG TPA: Lrp/AsnC family transcriptional regulator [Nitrososphaeraceae archaeon]|jgi:DNA-binding Lrp family transcriptional regulator